MLPAVGAGAGIDCDQRVAEQIVAVPVAAAHQGGAILLLTAMLLASFALRERVSGN